MIKASGNTVEGYWPGLFAKALKGQDITGLLSKIGSGGSGGGAAPAGDAGAGAGDAAPAKKAEKEEEPEEDFATGGLFGDDDDY